MLKGYGCEDTTAIYWSNELLVEQTHTHYHALLSLFSVKVS